MLPSISAPASTTTLAGTLHLSGEGYSVAGAGGETITVEHGSSTLSTLGLTDGAEVSLFVGYAVGNVVSNITAMSQEFGLRVELADAAGDLVYFASAGEEELQPAGGRVGIAFGERSCATPHGSGTGGGVQVATHDVNVTIDGAVLGSFSMGTPSTAAVGGKKFFVDDRDSSEIVDTGSHALSIVGRAIP